MEVKKEFTDSLPRIKMFQRPSPQCYYVYTAPETSFLSHKVYLRIEFPSLMKINFFTKYELFTTAINNSPSIYAFTVIS